jgi:hypothetical protein
MSNSICFMKLGVPTFGANVYHCYILLIDCKLYQYEVTFFVSSDQF